MLALMAGWGAVGLGLLALAPWLPPLLAQDYWRWAGFMTRRPAMSLANDVVFDCVQAAAFVSVLLLHAGSIPLLVSAWGLGGASGALVGLAQFRTLPSIVGGARLLRARWKLSRWIAGSSAVTWASAQAYVFVAAATLGPAGLGAIKAARTLVSGPAGVLIQAGGSVGLPEATKSYAERGERGLTRVARHVGVAGFLSFALVGAGVALWGRHLMSALYGQQFVKFWGAALLFALAYTVEAFVLGPILVLKTVKRTDAILYADTVELVLSVATTAFLCRAFGVDGAAEATIVTYCVGTMVFRWYQKRVLSGARCQSSAALAEGEGEPPVGDTLDEGAGGALARS
jgi:O-antigen/teichoic acid export membrane protein